MAGNYNSKLIFMPLLCKNSGKPVLMDVVSAQLGLAGIRAAKYVCSLQSRFLRFFGASFTAKSHC